jgi:hypothetical protein
LKQQQEIHMREKFYVSLDQITLVFDSLFRSLSELLPAKDIEVNSKETRYALMLRMKHIFDVQPALKRLKLTPQGNTPEVIEGEIIEDIRSTEE